VGKDIDKSWRDVHSGRIEDMVADGVRWRRVGDLQGDAFGEFDAIFNAFIRFPKFRTEC